MYLHKDGYDIQIQAIQSDDSGIFVVLNQSEERKYTVYTCPGCKKVYYSWENCNTPGCPNNRPH